MNLLDKLERRFGRFALPHLTAALIAAQVVVYILINAQPKNEIQEGMLERIAFIPAKVLEGEVWRLLTFLVIPPLTHPVWAFFAWYMFYLMGTALENVWGNFRYNVYLLIGYVASVAVSFVFPDVPSYNGFLSLSVFLAFAFVNPDFEIYIFFILPVKIKWLALLTWIGFAITVLSSDWLSRLLVLASTANFLLFFGKDLVDKIRTGRRRMARQAAQFAVAKEPVYFHRCRTCGLTDRMDRTMEFRYCSKCTGNCCYCQEHLKNHEHVEEQASRAP